MGYRRAYDVVYYGGTYTDNQGNERKRYQNCGVCLVDSETGRKKIKIDSLPANPEPVDGGGIWFDLYEPRDRDGQRPQQSQRRAPPHQQAEASQDFDEEIPF